MNIQTLNEKILGTVSSKIHVASSASYQLRDAANAIEKLLLQEKIDLLNMLYGNFNLPKETLPVSMILEIILHEKNELINKLNQ